MIDVITKGFYTLPVTTGRHGLERYGIPTGGPMDKIRCVAANRLVGNDEEAWSLELTALLPGLLFRDRTAIALVGGLDEFTIIRGGQSLLYPARATVYIEPGDQLLSAPIKAGLRAYLSIAGGLRYSSPLPQPLKNGDRLETAVDVPLPEIRRLDQNRLPPLEGPVVLRVIQGVHQDRFSKEGLKSFYGGTYTATAQSSRMGIQFSGEKIAFAEGRDGNIISEGMVSGDIQVTSAGLPILMMADCQTVGGYTKIAHVIAPDMSIAAQLKPGSQIQFRRVALSQAHNAAKKLWREIDKRLK